jgi:gas vesicle protein GvpA/GvpJ/GvpM family
VSITGDVVLGLAGIDLVYLRLSVLLCAADRVLPRDERPGRKPA